MQTDPTASCRNPPPWRKLHFLRLTKPGVVLWVLAATAAGFFMAGGQGENTPGRLLAALSGTALVAGGAAAMNQWMERKWDRLMPRTQGRPLPSRGIPPGTALAFGSGISVAGLALLAFGTTFHAAGLAAAALIIYQAAYTPLKRRTPACVIIGAVAGALPPVIGWTANGGVPDLKASLLFGILFLWQMPHLLAIAWRRRDEYAAAGFTLWGQRDLHGHRTAAAALGSAMLLAVTTQGAALAFRTGLSGFLALLLINAALIACAVRFFRKPTLETARGLFVATLVYLPLALAALALLSGG